MFNDHYRLLRIHLRKAANALHHIDGGFWGKARGRFIRKGDLSSAINVIVEACLVPHRTQSLLRFRMDWAYFNVYGCDVSFLSRKELD